jgi:hypothetical protein
MTHDSGWKRHGSRYLFESHWFNVRQDDVELPFAEAIERVHAGEINAGPSALALLLAEPRLRSDT